MNLLTERLQLKKKPVDKSSVQMLLGTYPLDQNSTTISKPYIL